MKRLTRRRIDRLLTDACALARKRRQQIRSRMCRGVTWEELLRMVGEAIPPGAELIVDDILAQIEEYDQRPPSELANGELRQDIHGFVYWLWGLQAGSSSLPEQIPLALLLAWRNGHAHHPAGASPVPVRRCEDCLLV